MRYVLLLENPYACLCVGLNLTTPSRAMFSMPYACRRLSGPLLDAYFRLRILGLFSWRQKSPKGSCLNIPFVSLLGLWPLACRPCPSGTVTRRRRRRKRGRTPSRSWSGRGGWRRKPTSSLSRKSKRGKKKWRSALRKIRKELSSCNQYFKKYINFF